MGTYGAVAAGGNYAEQAVEAIERGNYGQAKDILISAEQRCEAQYLEASETPGGNNTVPST